MVLARWLRTAAGDSPRSRLKPVSEDVGARTGSKCTVTWRAPPDVGRNSPGPRPRRGDAYDRTLSTRFGRGRTSRTSPQPPKAERGLPASTAGRRAWPGDGGPAPISHCDEKMMSQTAQRRHDDRRERSWMTEHQALPKDLNPLRGTATPVPPGMSTMIQFGTMTAGGRPGAARRGTRRPSPDAGGQR